MLTDISFTEPIHAKTALPNHIADVRVVHRWIRERLRNDAWPDDWPRLTAWDKFPYEKPTAKKLQRWCDRFLDTKQWKQLQAVIRSARRNPSRYRTVRLSRNAHEILERLAMRDKLTLSEVIERYLSRVAHASAQALQIAEQPSSHITSPQAYIQANPPATIKEAQSEID